MFRFARFTQNTLSTLNATLYAKTLQKLDDRRRGTMTKAVRAIVTGVVNGAGTGVSTVVS